VNETQLKPNLDYFMTLQLANFGLQEIRFFLISSQKPIGHSLWQIISQHQA
jgi:hypothetical protein